MEETATRGHKIKYLHGEAAKLMLESVITPEVNETLRAMIITLESDIEANIKADAMETQAAVNRSIQAFKDASTPLFAMKTSADSTGTASQSCSEEVVNLGQGHTDCVTAQNALSATALSLCEAGLQLSTLSVQTSPSVLSCDFTMGNCGDSITGYKTAVENWIALERTTIATKYSEYTAAKARCDTATQAFENKQSECVAKKTDHTNKMLECDHLQAAHQIAKCTFGDKLQVKCDKRAQHEALVAQITETKVAHTHSDFDRKTEWVATQQLKCLITKLTADRPLDSAAMADCTKDPDLSEKDFVDNVKWTDVMASEFESYISGELSCGPTMTSITFGGASEAFTRNQSHQPFEYCAATAGSTCGENYNCVVGANTYDRNPAATECLLSTGCTTADCCTSAPVITTTATAPIIGAMSATLPTTTPTPAGPTMLRKGRCDRHVYAGRNYDLQRCEMWTRQQSACSATLIMNFEPDWHAHQCSCCTDTNWAEQPIWDEQSYNMYQIQAA
jgi:hypothetical protein